MDKPVVLESRPIYRGRIFEVSVATIKEGETVYTREIIAHPGSVVIVPVFPDDSVALVRQYRHPAGKYLLELPAGSLSEGEDLEKGAQRELEEEIGVTAGKIEKLTEFYVSPGFLAEKMHLFLATDLTKTQQNLEPDEILSVERIPLASIPSLISSNQLEDAKTIIGLTLTSLRYGFNLT